MPATSPPLSSAGSAASAHVTGHNSQRTDPHGGPAPRPLSFALNQPFNIDSVALEARAQAFTKRSLKKDSKVKGLKLAMSMLDLSALEGKDSPERIRNRCQKAMRPDPSDPSIPAMAAICVYPSMVAVARKALWGSTVKTASVATAFPSGQASLELKLLETRQAIESGAEEIDMVMSRGAFLAGSYQQVYDEIAAIKDVCGSVCLKVILETGELVTYDNIRRASWIAMTAGADFIKTSTGKVAERATLANTLCMLEAIRDFFQQTGRRVGMKPAGNVTTAKLTLAYLVELYETLGPDWMTPDLYRIGASTLANELLLQLRKERDGHYQSLDYFSND